MKMIPNKKKEASALLTTLLVISLLLVTVLSLVVVVRMELRKLVGHQETLQARANARLGAELAMAKLQELTGLDTRITLPAAADSGLSPHENNRFWTGVRSAAPYRTDGTTWSWNESYTRHLGWLVSSVDGDPDPEVATVEPDGSARGGHVLVVGGGSVEEIPDRVAAQLVNVRGGAGSNSGRLAWWVGEENTKAQINLTDPFALAPDPDTDAYRAMTVQRVGSEHYLERLDPEDLAHWDEVQRMETRGQADLMTFQAGELGLSGHLFHHASLGAYGLLTNPRSGGLKRDLFPVVREAWDNGGAPPSGAGTEFNELLDFQNRRIQRLREQTVAAGLPGSRPAEVPEHAWNAARAVTLRADQADTNLSPTGNGAIPLRELIFPPFSDMHLSKDATPSWRQLLSYTTLARRNPEVTLSPGRHLQDEVNAYPVIARFNLATYFTFDWPRVRMHFIPTVVLWNPWNRPLAGTEYFLDFAYTDLNNLRGFSLMFKVSHPSWRGGDQVWTPPYKMDFQTVSSSSMSGDDNYRGTHRFRFVLDATEIPAGAAMAFTMPAHRKMDDPNITAPGDPTGTWSAVPNLSSNQFGHIHSASYGGSYPRIRLAPGLIDEGGYSFYIEEEAMAAKTQLWADDPTSAMSNRTRQTLPIYGTRDAGGTWTPSHANTDNPAHQPIAINDHGLDLTNWEVHKTALILHSGVGATSLINQHLRLALNENDFDRIQNPQSQPLVALRRLFAVLPSNIHSLGYDDPDNTALTGFDGPPPSFPGDNRPFLFADSSFPSYPTWGLAWSLRLPNSKIFYSPLGTGAHVGAPLQWLSQSNPTAAYHQTMPLIGLTNVSRLRGYAGNATLIGGFVTDPEMFNMTETTDDDLRGRYHFIGHSDAQAPEGMQTGDIPRAILREVLDSPDAFVSVASFQHAPLHGLNATRVTGSQTRKGSYPVAEQTNSNNYGRELMGGNLHPVYPVGNSILHPLAHPDRAARTIFPINDANPDPAVPAQGFDLIHPNWNELFKAFPWYDMSWVLNDQLWDDFFLSSPANSRLQWENDVEDRDFHDSAGRVSVVGAFNVNSTSVDAWAALLKGLLDVEIPNRDGEPPASPDERVPFARFLEPQRAPYSPDAGDRFDSLTNFTGNRALTLEEVDLLAEKIVEEVKKRGPFLSMSDFVNRRLISAGGDPEGTRLMGALQAAIEAAGLNNRQVSAVDANSFMTGAEPSFAEDLQWHGYNRDALPGATNRGAPGYLLQGDVLARVGSVLQVRSDTFTIRAYGDTPSGARAWCEVTVRRRPEYVETLDDPAALPPDLTRPANIRFGRRYEVIRFRWLSEENM
jgi:hypothetical protein